MSLLWGNWNPGRLGPFNSRRFQVNDIRWMVAKSCTSWEVVYPIIYRVSTIQGDAGFLWISPIHIKTYYLSLIQLNIEIYLLKTKTCNKIGHHDKHISKRETYGFKQWICHQTNAKQMNSTEMYWSANDQWNQNLLEKTEIHGWWMRMHSSWWWIVIIHATSNYDRQPTEVLDTSQLGIKMGRTHV